MNEDLSRLWAGELDAEAERALRHRIATEPEVARAWGELRRMVEQLESLPDIPPPPELDARVLGIRRRPRWPWVAAAAAAAVVVGGLAVHDAPPARITVVEGVHEVDGRAVIDAGALAIDVDGRARVSVEPVDRVVRVPPREDPMKIVGAGVAGVVVGAAVTVMVRDGTATVRDGGEVIALEAGQTRTFAAPASEAPPPPPDATPAARIAWLEAQNEALRQQLAEAEFTGAVARGQVASTQGAPVPWPEAPGTYAPDAFAENLRTAVAQVPGLEVLEVECSEYPCVATLVSTAPTAELQDQLKSMSNGLTTSAYPDAGVWIGVSTSEGPEGVRTGVGFTLIPPEVREDDAVRTRTDWRGQALLQEFR